MDTESSKGKDKSNFKNKIRDKQKRLLARQERSKKNLKRKRHDPTHKYK